MKIEISDKFNYKKLLKYTLPSIIMMVFTSVYGVVDGFFVSNYVGDTAFAAVNFIIPFTMILGSVGFMLGTGGSALIGKLLGEGEKEKANQTFSFLVYSSIVIGALLVLVGVFCMRPVARLLGAEGQMLEDAVVYGDVLVFAIPAYILQYEFQCYFATSGKPTLGLIVTVAAGLTNIFLDWLFVGVLGWGLIGAAVATDIGQCVGGILPLFYFFTRNTSSLRLGRAKWDGIALLKTCTNGSSELMSNIAMSVVSMLYNAQLLKYFGQDGVSAYGVLMYVNMVFIAIFIGYSVGSAPIISYNYGAGDTDQLKSLRRKSFVIIATAAVLMFGSSFILAKPLATIFVSYKPELMDLTLHAFGIFSFSFLLSGFSIFSSSFFTALNDGLTSALISFLRTLVFQIAAVLIFPLIWDVDGIWWSIVAAEIMSVCVSVVFLFAKKKKYNY